MAGDINLVIWSCRSSPRPCPVMIVTQVVEYDWL